MSSDSKASKLLERMRGKQSGAGKAPGKAPAKAPPAKAGVEPVPAIEPPPVSQECPRRVRRKGPLFRLPHGSEFLTAYDGEAQVWTCLLTVPGLAPYEIRTTSVHAGIQRLGQRWWREHGQPAGEPSQAG